MYNLGRAPQTGTTQSESPMSKMTILRPGMLAEQPAATAEGAALPSGAKTSESRLPIDSSVIPVLINEHRQMLDLLQAVDAYLARNQHGSARSSLAKLHSLLERHFSSEFQQIYSRLDGAMAALGGRRPAELIREERTQVQQMFAFFGCHLGTDRRAIGSEEFVEAFRRFSMELIEHTEREERELFPLLCAADGPNPIRQ